jgi:hypothetical protein
MSEEKTFDEDLQNIGPDRNWAKVIIKIVPPLSIEKAQAVLNRLNINIISIKRVTNQHLVFILNTKDIRPIVLSLVENGFTEIKGLNAFNGSFKNIP